MHFVEKEPSQKRSDLVKKLKTNKILRVPGAYNPLTAKLIEEIGYDAVYVSGGVMANDLGISRYWTNFFTRCKHKIIFDIKSNKFTYYCRYRYWI